jgi:hypothetical protein
VIRKVAIYFLFIVFNLNLLFGQEILEKDFLEVYVDCSFCSMNDIRNEAPYLTYVREALLADVHILATRISSGANAYKYTFRFLGRRDFKGTEFSRSFDENADMTLADRQKLIRSTIEVGLLPFWSQTQMANRLNVKITEKDDKGRASNRPGDHDPWNNWVIAIEGGSSLDFEKIRKESRFWGRLAIDRVTEVWKIRNLAYARSDFQVFESDEETIRSTISRSYASTSVVFSIDDHWSGGVFLSASQSTFDNLDISTRIAPAFEYSLFPYSDVQEKEITLGYRISHLYRDYVEETIFDKLNENLFGQSIVMTARFTQPWGNLYAQLEGSHFFHDLKQNRIEFDARLNVRLVKGLSLSLGNNIDFINDQRSLPKRDISLEELLLAQRQAATSFRMGGQMGISYTFGSIYNNVVNTRL